MVAKTQKHATPHKLTAITSARIVPIEDEASGEVVVVVEDVAREEFVENAVLGDVFRPIGFTRCRIWPFGVFNAVV